MPSQPDPPPFVYFYMAAPGDAVMFLPRLVVIAFPAGDTFLLRWVVIESLAGVVDCFAGTPSAAGVVFLLRSIVCTSPAISVDCFSEALPVAGMVLLLCSIAVVYPAAMDCSVETRPGSAVALCLHDFVNACLLHWTVSIFLLRWAVAVFLPH